MKTGDKFTERNEILEPVYEGNYIKLVCWERWLHIVNNDGDGWTICGKCDCK